MRERKDSDDSEDFWPERLEEWRPHLLRREKWRKNRCQAGKPSVSLWVGFEMSDRFPSGGVDSGMREELREEDYLRNRNFVNDFICKSPKHTLSYISLLLFF